MRRELLLIGCVLLLAGSSQSAGRIAEKNVTSAKSSEMDGGLPQHRPDAKAEVEITGRLKTPIRTKKFVAFVTKEACNPKLGAKKALRAVAVDPNVSMNFFLEIFVPQGSSGHVCGAGYDEHDKLVLFGAYSGNPLTFVGEGEVSFSQLSIPLEPVSIRWREEKASSH